LVQLLDQNEDFAFLEISFSGYIQSMESKPYSNERMEARRIQGLIDDPHVSEAYRNTLRKYIQKKKSREMQNPHFDKVIEPILEFNNF